MKIKDLFKTIEAANFVASQIGGKRVYIECETLSKCRGYDVALPVDNVRDNSRRFYNFNDFAASIASDYTEDVCALVGKQQLANHCDGVFTCGNQDICDDCALRFVIYHD